MKIGFVGLGRMGFNMVTRLARDEQEVVATTRDQEKVRQISAEPNVSGAASLDEMVAQLQPPRAVWIMVTSGEATDAMIKRVAGLLSPGDTIVDAGNSMLDVSPDLATLRRELRGLLSLAPDSPHHFTIASPRVEMP